MLTIQEKQASTRRVGSSSSASNQMNWTRHSPAFDETYLLRTGQLFVARQPMQCVAERPRVERGDGNRIVALHTCFGPKFESDGGVPADFKDSPVQREHLLGCKQDLFLV